MAGRRPRLAELCALVERAQVRALRKETDGPLMFANALGMRASASWRR
ncbi:hypothetical protein [Streptomyces aquilus]|nr:hypothetical protein [Streptomyces aquilus]